MNLNEARQMTIEAIAEHLPEWEGWHFGWMERKTAIGLCDYRSRTIFLSINFVRVMERDAVMNTVLHEIAHALTPGQKHNAVWKRTFVALGGDGKRTSYTPEAHDKTAKYEILCAVTNQSLGYAHRKGKALARSVCRCHEEKPVWIQRF